MSDAPAKVDPLADLFTAPAVTFAVEPFSFPLVEELLPLFFCHYREIATYQDIELKPRWEKYELLAQNNLLRIHTMRQSGKAIGYAVWILDGGHLHYADSKQATNDVLYLAPEHRGKLLGMRFIKWCEEHLKAEGIQSMVLHIKFAHDWSPMAERMGFKYEEIIMRKRLDL